MNSKKIIFTHGGGRFGNQLINYIHLSAFGIENKNISIKQSSLNEYLFPKYEEFIVSNGKIHILSIIESKQKGKFINILIRALKNSKIRLMHFFAHYFLTYKSLIIGANENNIGYLLGTKTQNLALDKEFLGLLGNKTLIAGWGIRNWQLVNKWKETISQNLVSTLKKENSDASNYSIGVHIRGTDFISHADGSLYFDGKDWINALKIIEKKLDVKNVIIMSDELQDWDYILKGNEHWGLSIGSFGQEGTMFDSFSDLLKCDLILTAGSTFALMASWISNAKLIDISEVASDKPLKVMKFEEWSNHKNFLINWK